MAQDMEPRQIIKFNHHGIATLLNVVCCIVPRLLLWLTVELGVQLESRFCGRDEKTLGLRGKTQEEVVETTTNLPEYFCLRRSGVKFAVVSPEL